MNPKILLARWIASRIETRTRAQRRALRDYQRRETALIDSSEKRSRGLRLYIAWTRRGHRKPAANSRQVGGEWTESCLPQAV